VIADRDLREQDRLLGWVVLLPSLLPPMIIFGLGTRQIVDWSRSP
jgi:hypothetical protein